MTRHDRIGVALGLWLAAVVALPLACVADAQVLGRVSDSAGLGFDGDQYGIELSVISRHVAIDLVATAASKADGGDGYAARLVIEREVAADLHFGLRAVHSDFDLYAKTTAGPVLTYRLPLDESLSLRLRLYGPGTEAPHEWGAAARLDAAIGRFIAAIEFEGWRFGNDDGRRVAILAGGAW